MMNRILGLVIVAVVLMTSHSRHTVSGQEIGQTRTVAREQRAALKSGGLKAAAAITGSYITSIDVNVGGPVTLEQLVSFSHVIFIGDSDKAVSRLTPDGRSIVLLNTVTVQSALKGPVDVGSDVIVLIPGGRISFPDGSWSLVKTPGFLKPQPGRKYLWFGRVANASGVKGYGLPAERSSRVFMPSYGPIGIVSLGEPEAQLSALYDNAFTKDFRAKAMTPGDFLKTVRRTIASFRDGR